MGIILHRLDVLIEGAKLIILVRSLFILNTTVKKAKILW